MPLIEVTIGAGRTPEQLRAMIHHLHTAVLDTIDTRPEHVRVIVREVPRTHWATGDQTLAEMDAARSAPVVATTPVAASAVTTPKTEEQP